MPFEATWMDLETVILSEVRQRKTNMVSLIYGILKNNTNELIYKTEMDSQTSKTKLMVTKGERLVGGGIN